MIDFNELASAARPTNDDDWGSERQVTAQNLFFYEIEKVLPADQFAALEAFCLKATTDEMVDEAIKMLSEYLLAQLTDEYETWNKAQGLTLGSADEHFFDESLTDAQRAFLRDFSQRWERAATVHGARGFAFGEG